MKRLLPLLIALSTAVAFALPEVSDVTMKQDGRRVTTIEYRLSEAPVILMVDIQTNANGSLDQADPGWMSIGTGNFTNLVGHNGTLVTSSGVNRLVWDARASWPDHRTKGARAVLTVWPTNAAYWASNTEFWERVAAEAAAEAERQRLLAHPLYMVVDLEAAPGDNVAYYTAESELPGGIGSDVYRTTKMVFRKIQAFGKTAKLGAPVGQVGRRDNSEMEHYVKFSHDYYIGVFEVTQKQYELVFGSNPSSVSKGDEAVWGTRPVDKGYFVELNAYNKGLRDNNWPGEDEASAHQITDEATFIYKMRAHCGLGLYLDLPTAAQWEFACRAGTGTALPNGEDISPDSVAIDNRAYSFVAADPSLEPIARYYMNSGAADGVTAGASVTTTAQGTARVGSYAPNAWGLYDMIGNVGEWCLDFLSSYSENTKETPEVDPRGATGSNINQKSVRGGAWNTPDIRYGLRSAATAGYGTVSGQGRGFRMCLTLKGE